jgi:glycosyltransferase involved in cell wall biosynthesis
MNVLHIGTSDNSGGAARAAFRLHTGLKNAGVDSHMLVGHQVENLPEIDQLPRRDNIFQKILRRAVTAVERWTGMQYLIIPWKRQFLRNRFTRKADVINLHNIHGGFFSYTILPELTAEKPVVWTLHDPWPMTGHCGYPEMNGSDRWKIGCGSCPVLSDYPPISIDTTAFLWRMKQKSYKKSNITLVAPSNWLATMTRESPLLSHFDIEVIPYGLDTASFAPLSRAKVRAELGLPSHAKIVFFTAHGVDNPRKGGRLLLHSLRDLAVEFPELLLLSIGEGEFSDAELGNIRAVQAGFVKSDAELVRYYAAANVYAMPTLADNMPNSVLESMACGRPVVAFNTGGIPDMVENGVSGLVVPKGDTDALRDALRLILTDADLADKMGERAREAAVSNFDSAIQARRYSVLYERVIRQRESSGATAYSLEAAAQYWRQVPSATYRIDTRELAAKPDSAIAAEWERGLKDYLKGWKRSGYLPMLESLRDRFRGKVLMEVGCGFGFEHNHFFSPVVDHSYLCDIVPSNVAVVGSVLRAKNLVRSEAVLLDYSGDIPVQPADFIYSHGVLHHVPFETCRKTVIPKITTGLKSGGRVIAMFYTRDYYRNVSATSNADFAAKTEAPVPGRGNPWSEPYDEVKVQQLFGDGFKLVSAEYYNDRNFMLVELEKTA